LVTGKLWDTRQRNLVFFFFYLNCNELKEYALDLRHSALAQVPLLPKREKALGLLIHLLTKKNMWHKKLIEEKTWLGSLRIEVVKIMLNFL